jgi:choline-sulfatase
LLRVLLRLLIAAGGAALAALFVAVFEARAVVAAAGEAGEQPLPDFVPLYFADLGLLCPTAIGIGAGVGALFVVLGIERPLAILASLRAGPVPERLRAASALPIGILTAFAWCVATAHVAKLGMASGKPAEAGLSIAMGAVGAFVVLALVALASFPALRRGLAAGSTSVPQLLDPALTTGIALLLVALLFMIGLGVGDTSGAHGGALGIFGVLKRPELDLRPVANAAVLAAAAFVIGAAVPSPRVRGAPVGRAPFDKRVLAVAGAGALLQLVLLGLCVTAAVTLEAGMPVTRGLETHAPLGKPSLAILRRLTDHDRDGFSARFGGGDCNDDAKAINPGAIDVPGNEIDEDCSGADTPAAEVAPPPAVAKKDQRPKKTFNVILLTVDTLRPDLGFMGYDKPTSPNLDKLAEKATVFEHAYSMASYTGKAVGPMLIGRYPSETITNFDHFNTYYDANVLVTERLKEAGIRTFAGMCHWYFRPSSGLKQGFDIWDTSAIPPGMGDNDTSVTSERMADLALRLLQRPDNVAGETDDPEKPFRFFSWFHFFDPHAQYVAHEGAPDVSSKGRYGAARTLYDQEVWFTDKHIGRVIDYVASQPWGAETAFVMTADHGEAFFEHGMNWHGVEVWEELVHVPLFVYVPGAEPRRVTQKRSHIDLAPTILELMGVPLPEDESLRGRSLLTDVYLPEGAEHEERDVYIDMPAGPFNQLRRAILTGPTPGMKLIHFGGFNYQLFDLAADPDEKKNLSSDKEKLDAAIKAMNAMRGRLKEIEPRK